MGVRIASEQLKEKTFEVPLPEGHTYLATVLQMKLVNTAAVKQYDGLKYSDDQHDAFWLAHIMRLGILPTGYIYPKEKRAIRDLLRRRLSLVRSASTRLVRALD